MIRKCSRCQKDFTPAELSREESRGMEAQRKAMGLQGVLFRYYACAACGNADIFVDLHPLPGEADEAFRRRRDEMEATVKLLDGDGVDVVLAERP
jgi:hypothetical protein